MEKTSGVVLISHENKVYCHGLRSRRQKGIRDGVLIILVKLHCKEEEEIQQRLEMKWG
jgi:hypothetical protein